MPILKTKLTGNFTTLPNALFRSKKLSWAAKGLLCYALSCEDGWKFSINNLVSVGTSKEDAIKTILKELQREGYLEITKLNSNQTESKKFEYVYTFSDTPVTNPHTEVPSVEIPSVETPGYNNTKLTNTNNIIKQSKDCFISPSQDFPPKGVQSLNAQEAPVYNTIITSKDNIQPGKPYNFTKQDNRNTILADGDNTKCAGSTVHGQMSTYDGLFVADRQEDTPAPASKLDKYFKKLKNVPIKQEHYPYFVRWIQALLTKKIRQTDVQFISQGTHLNEYITSANFNANVLEEAFKLLEDTDNGYRNIIKALKNCSVPQKTSYKSEVQKQKEALDMFIRKPGCM